MYNKPYQKLLVWQRADALAYDVYVATQFFPKEELYGICSQLRRSALSVPVNIVEGCGRQNKKETKQFINIALGSLAETEYFLEFSLKLGYLTPTLFSQAETLRSETGKLLWLFYKSL